MLNHPIGAINLKNDTLNFRINLHRRARIKAIPNTTRHHTGLLQCNLLASLKLINVQSISITKPTPVRNLSHLILAKWHLAVSYLTLIISNKRTLINRHRITLSRLITRIIHTIRVMIVIQESLHPALLGSISPAALQVHSKPKLITKSINCRRILIFIAIPIRVYKHRKPFRHAIPHINITRGRKIRIIILADTHIGHHRQFIVKQLLIYRQRRQKALIRPVAVARRKLLRYIITTTLILRTHSKPLKRIRKPHLILARSIIRNRICGTSKLSRNTGRMPNLATAPRHRTTKAISPHLHLRILNLPISV